MLTLSFISFILYISYIISIIIINGNKIPIHLSQSYYILKNGWIFTLFMFIIVFLTIIPLLEITPTSFQFLGFITCASVCFIGASPNFIDDLEGKIHKYSAIIAILSSQILIAILSPLILISWTLLAIMYFYIKKHNKKNNVDKWLFWVELLSFINIYILVFLRL